MKTLFVLKELDGTRALANSLDIQCGTMFTEIHWHPCAEVIYMKSGEARIFLAERWETLHEGDAVFIPTGALHCCHCSATDACRVVLGFDECALLSECALPDFFDGGVPTAANPLIFHGGEVASLLNQATMLPKDAAVSARIAQRIFIETIFLTMLRIWEAQGYLTKKQPLSPLTDAVENLIAESFSEALRASDVAKRLNISYSMMAATLRRERGMSFEELLLLYRIEASKRLLLTTDKSATEIALEVGFTDASYFIKKFRIATSTTPHQYRLHNRISPKKAEKGYTRVKN
ncbi:MAG: AraC family transcriptional regulator [Clostridia bacterium]|nr:AraC family transcriptional regulator [Clostridia bacterium]